MARVVLIAWRDPGVEEHAAALRRSGHDASVLSPEGGRGLAPLVATPPDAVVIDLDRLPSHGSAVGAYLRQRKSTRAVPLVFAGGEEEKVAKVRGLLPDAAFCSWRGLAATLRKALAAPGPAVPVVPDTMAGYSGTPLPRKLGIGPGRSARSTPPGRASASRGGSGRPDDRAGAAVVSRAHPRWSENSSHSLSFHHSASTPWQVVP